MWKKSKKSVETAISVIFPAIFAGKKYFSKIGLLHILGTIIFHQCANFHEKI